MKILIIYILAVSSLFSGEYIFLGNPYTKQYKSGEEIYARNIWDMQLYKDKIYLGAGNSSNEGPAANAGRVYVVSLDPKTDKFRYEYKAAEEQIDVIKVYGDTLYIPGHDATQKWTFGNIYTKKNKKWKKYRTLPKALHVYDLVVKNGKIFTAIGLYGKGAVYVSDMDALKWEKISHGSGRVYSFIEVGNNLFATKTFKTKHPHKLNITQWLKERETFSSRFDLNVYKMFPNTKLYNSSIKIIKSLKTCNGAFYIGAYKHNDHQNKPFGVYFINPSLNVKKIMLQKNEVPRDILRRDKSVFLLTSKNKKIKVYKIDKNISSKKAIVAFQYPTFARSFEKYKNCFYFGMGSEIKNSKRWEQRELLQQTGNILKVCQNKKFTF